MSEWVAINKAKHAPNPALRMFAYESNFRRLTRSTMPPIGIAKSNHGNIASAGIKEISTGFRVNERASKPAEIWRIPSAKLLAILADHKRLNGLPRLDFSVTDFCEIRDLLVLLALVVQHDRADVYCKTNANREL